MVHQSGIYTSKADPFSLPTACCSAAAARAMGLQLFMPSHNLRLTSEKSTVQADRSRRGKPKPRTLYPTYVFISIFLENEEGRFSRPPPGGILLEARRAKGAPHPLVLALTKEED